MLVLTDGENAVYCRKHFGSICLGCVRPVGVASVFSLWRNGKSMSNVCHSNLYCKCTV